MLRDALPLRHIARPPEQKDEGKPPVLMMLHGVGSNERDLFRLASSLDPRLYVLSLQGPEPMGPDQHGWYDLNFAPDGPKPDPGQIEETRQTLVSFIERAATHYPVDPGRVYLFGFSQGAIMSLTLLLTHPEPVSGVVAVAGRMLPELFMDGTPLSGKLADVGDLKGKSLFLAHGLQDEVMPVQYGRQAEQIISRSPIELTYREYEMSHAVSPRCLQEIDLWLQSQLGPARVGSAEGEDE